MVMSQTATARKQKFYVVLLPFNGQPIELREDESIRPFVVAYLKLRRNMQEAGIPCIELTRMFDNMSPREIQRCYFQRCYYQADGHFRPAGNRRAAEVMVRQRRVFQASTAGGYSPGQSIQRSAGQLQSGQP